MTRRLTQFLSIAVVFWASFQAQAQLKKIPFKDPMEVQSNAFAMRGHTIQLPRPSSVQQISDKETALMWSCGRERHRFLRAIVTHDHAHKIMKAGRVYVKVVGPDINQTTVQCLGTDTRYKDLDTFPTPYWK